MEKYPRYFQLTVNDCQVSVTHRIEVVIFKEPVLPKSATTVIQRPRKASNREKTKEPIARVNDLVQSTLVIIKPDSVRRGLVGKILSRFERVGLQITSLVNMAMQPKDLHHHYQTIGKVGDRHGDRVLQSLIDFMQESPVFVVILTGIEAVEVVRKLIGSTEPKTASPGTIRGDYAHASYAWSKSEGRSISNLVHSSATVEEAKLEIAHWNSVIYGASGK